MATPNPTLLDRGEDNFVLGLKEVRRQINQKFIELIDCIRARECELLEELDAILASYHLYRNEFEKQDEKKRELEIMQNSLLPDVTNSFAKNLQDKIMTEITENIQSIPFPAEPKMVNFLCESDTMLAELGKLGRLVEEERSAVDYKSKVCPVVSVCQEGNGMEELNSPRGVAIDEKTGNIYVADQSNQCVKVFNDSGKILFKFGDLEGNGRMEYPGSLVISGERILVSNGKFWLRSGHKILIYQLNGQFISKIGKYGKGKNEFNYPRGLACDESKGDVYICDSDNNRIQILSKELKFKSQLGADKLRHPLDVKLSKDYILILDESNPCIHMYGYDLNPLESNVSRGNGMQVVNPIFFFIDNSKNILISDYGSDCILIFDSLFKLIHKIDTVRQPMGVAVDKRGRIIVVCEAEINCLQIF